MTDLDNKQKREKEKTKGLTKLNNKNGEQTGETKSEAQLTQQQVNQAELIYQQLIKDLTQITDEIKKLIAQENANIKDIIFYVGSLFKKCTGSQYIANNKQEVILLLQQIGEKIASQINAHAFGEYVILIKSRFINTLPEFYNRTMHHMFNCLVDTQTRISLDFDVNSLPQNLYSLQKKELSNPEKILQAIFQCGKLVLENSLYAQFIDTANDVIIKLLQTAIMFKRVEEAKQLIKGYNLVKIGDDPNSEKALKIVQTKITIVTCMISLQLNDQIEAQLEHNVYQLQEKLYSEHLNVCCKYFRVTQQYLPLLVALVNYIRITNTSDRIYKIEALCILSSFQLIDFQKQSEIELLLNNQFSLNQFQQFILLQEKLPGFIDFSNTYQIKQGILGLLESFLLNSCQFEEDFKKYITCYLNPNCRYFQKLEQKASEFLKEGFQLLNSLSASSRDYISYADLQIKKLISNFIIISVQQNEQFIDLKQLFAEITQIAEKEIGNISDYERKILFSDSIYKQLIIQIVKEKAVFNIYKNIDVQILYKEYKLQKAEVQEVNKSSTNAQFIVSQKTNLLELLKKNIHFNLKLEMKNYPQPDQVMQIIQDRKDLLKKRSNDLYDQEQKRMAEQHKEQKKIIDENNKKLQEQQKQQQRCDFYYRQCKQFIYDQCISVGDDEVAAVLNDQLDQQSNQFEQQLLKKQDEKVQQPEQWLSVLNKFLNNNSGNKIQLRVDLLKQGFQEIEAKLYYYNKKYYKSRFQAEKAKQMEKINDLIVKGSIRRYEYETEQYNREQEFIRMFDGIPNVQNLIQAQDDLDKLQHTNVQLRYQNLVKEEVQKIEEEIRLKKEQRENEQNKQLSKREQQLDAARKAKEVVLLYLERRKSNPQSENYELPKGVYIPPQMRNQKPQHQEHSRDTAVQQSANYNFQKEQELQKHKDNIAKKRQQNNDEDEEQPKQQQQVPTQYVPPHLRK